jgi:hypothetical protein
LHFDGTAWTPMVTPNTTATLQAVYGVGRDVFVVGTGATIWKLNN